MELCSPEVLRLLELEKAWKLPQNISMRQNHPELLFPAYCGPLSRSFWFGGSGAGPESLPFLTSSLVEGASAAGLDQQSSTLATY